ncbi:MULTISPECIES: hypothetical protein [unclassified Actinoplanes]|uniref:hypothetical protein n=1 Tax=unclassified Actinoplanes TaxID=2626549 RepID=UPI001E3C563B|nr:MULTISPECIES: hypothetical protein [unclassified Actinoplanes]
MNANDTADRDTPAAAATSLDVGLPPFAIFSGTLPALLMKVLAGAFLDGMHAPRIGAHHNPL